MKIKRYKNFLIKEAVSYKEIEDELQWFTDNYEIVTEEQWGSYVSSDNGFGYISADLEIMSDEDYNDGRDDVLGEGLVRVYKLEKNEVAWANSASNPSDHILSNVNCEVLEELALRKRNLEEMGYKVYLNFDINNNLSLLIYKHWTEM